MAKTQYSIHVTYKNAKNQISQLENLAKKVDDKRIELENCRNQISGCWKGECADAYRNKMDVQIRSLSAAAGRLKQIASTADTIAGNAYIADRRAIELAKEREYGGGAGGGGGR